MKSAAFALLVSGAAAQKGNVNHRSKRLNDILLHHKRQLTETEQITFENVDRELASRDNNYRINWYSDSTCTNLEEQDGFVSGECLKWDKDFTMAVKVNSADQSAFFLEWDGGDCKGLPQKILDVQTSVGLTGGWGQCFVTSSGSMNFEFHDEKPKWDEMPTGEVYTYTSKDYCETESPGFYSEWYYYKGGCMGGRYWCWNYGGKDREGYDCTGPQE